MKYQKPKGTADILPGESEKWHFVEETARKVFSRYEFHELRTPIFEHFEVVSRSVGETTDIVTKEMYDFYDKGDRHITLRPEGTAPLVRSYVENKLFGPEHQRPLKAYYMGPMFRYERAQAGRFRQFHQIGAEVIGSNNPMTDVETMVMLLDFYRELGIKNTRLVINSLGDRESRKVYRQALIDYLEPLEAKLSEDSKRRLHENPLRVLDSKDAKDKEIVAAAPSILEYLDEPSAAFFAEVKRLLTGLGVEFEVDHRMVRGLDYYNHTVFEIMSDAPGFGGAITTICAGGRYDGLIGEFDGPAEVDTGFGFALGIERTLITLAAEGVELPINRQADAYVVGIGEATDLATMKLSHFLRDQGLIVEQDFLNRNIKPQLKSANKLGVKFVVIIGEAELADNKIQIKNMQTGADQLVDIQSYYQNYDKIMAEVMKAE